MSTPDPLGNVVKSDVQPLYNKARAWLMVHWYSFGVGAGVGFLLAKFI